MFGPYGSKKAATSVNLSGREIVAVAATLFTVIFSFVF